MTYLARLSANVELVPVAASPGAAVRCPSPGQRGPLSLCSPLRAARLWPASLTPQPDEATALRGRRAALGRRVAGAACSGVLGPQDGARASLRQPAAAHGDRVFPSLPRALGIRAPRVRSVCGRPVPRV